MARVTLIEAAPWDAAGVAGTAYLAGGGARGYDHRGRTSWKGGVVREPKFTSAIGFDQSGWTGGALPQVGRLAFFPALASTLTEIAALQWIGAPIEILVGDDDLAAPVWTTLLKGNVASIKIVGGMVEFVVADAAGKKLADPFLKTRFLGTGGAEGDAEVEGRIKRRSFGKTFNVEGRVLRKAYNVFEFSDPTRPLQGFTSVRDKGRVGIAGAPIAWAGSIAATLAALEAATPPAGGYVAAPSIACVKWWTIPSGPLTADIQGEIGAGYINTATAIATRIAEEYSVTVAAPSASVNATKGATAEAGLHVAEESDTVANVLDRILLPCGLVWVLDAAGVMSIRDISLANPVEAITISGEIDRVEGYRAVRSRKLAYQRAYRKHDAGEISAAVLVEDVEGLGGLATLDIVKLGSAGPMRREDGTTPVTDAAVVTSIGTAAAITGQGALATLGQVDYAVHVTGSTMPEPNATASDNLVKNGDLRAGTSFWYQNPGTAANQSRIAGVAGEPVPAYWRFTGSADVRANDQQLIGVTGGSVLYLSATVRRGTTAGSWASIQIWQYDAVGALLANPTLILQPNAANVFQALRGRMTLNANAASIRVHANPAGATVGSPIDIGLIRVAPTERDATLGADINSNIVDGGAGGATVPRTDLRTSLGTAAAITGQGTLATLSAAAWGTHITGRPAELTDGRVAAGLDQFGDLARNIATTRANASNLLRYTAGGLFTGELAADVTATHVASGITGQGALATLSSVSLEDTARVTNTTRISRLNATTGRALPSFADDEGQAFSRIARVGSARNGDAINFGSTLATVPQVVFLPGGHAATAGRNVAIQAQNLTASGFTMRAVDQAVTAGTTYTDGSAVAGGGGEPSLVINRTNGSTPFDGRFKFSITVTVGDLAPGEPGLIRVGLYCKQGGSWVQVGEITSSASGTFVQECMTTADFGAGNEFGVSVLYAEGSGTALNSFNSVVYSSGTVTETSLTPSSTASSIPYLVLLA